MTVFEPIAGSVLAAGTKKTIRWVGPGLRPGRPLLASGASAPCSSRRVSQTLGYYFWNVPAVPFRNDYYMEVACADSNGVAAGRNRQQPGVHHRVERSGAAEPRPGNPCRGNGVVRVAWKASAAVAGVNIFVKSGSGGETQVATNVTGTTFKDIIFRQQSRAPAG